MSAIPEFSCVSESFYDLKGGCSLLVRLGCRKNFPNDHVEFVINSDDDDELMTMVDNTDSSNGVGPAAGATQWSGVSMNKREFEFLIKKGDQGGQCDNIVAAISEMGNVVLVDYLEKFTANTGKHCPVRIHRLPYYNLQKLGFAILEELEVMLPYVAHDHRVNLTFIDDYRVIRLLIHTVAREILNRAPKHNNGKATTLTEFERGLEALRRVTPTAMSWFLSSSLYDIRPAVLEEVMRSNHTDLHQNVIYNELITPGCQWFLNNSRNKRYCPGYFSRSVERITVLKPTF